MGAVAAGVVAGVSFALFHPDLEPGPNETEEHVREDVLLAYVLPCTMAAASGAVRAPRLLVSRPK